MESKQYEELTTLIKSTKEEIDKALEKSKEEARNASADQIKKVSDDTKTEIKGLIDKLNAYQEKHDKFVEDQGKVQEQLDGISSDVKKIKTFGSDGSGKIITLDNSLMKALDNDDFRKFTDSRKSGRATTEFKLEIFPSQIKAPGDMTFGASTTNEVAPPQYVPSIVRPTLRTTAIRQLFPQAAAQSNTIYFVKETGGEGCPDMTAEAAEKHQFDIDLTASNVTVKKIAGYLKISEEMLEDIPALQGYLTSRASEKYRYTEDKQLLYGTGVGNEITGITVNADTLTSNPFGEVISGANKFSVLRAAMANLMTPHTLKEEWMADAIILHPIDYLSMKELKGDDDHYLRAGVFGNFITENGGIFFDGIPVFLSTAIAQGEFIVGSFAMGAQIFDKKGVNVRFYDQNEDDAIKNMITIVIEGRLALAIYREKAFVYDTFADGLAVLATT